MAESNDIEHATLVVFDDREHLLQSDNIFSDK
jgi:hypothetical protein